MIHSAHVGKEMALAHALSAERLLDQDVRFLNDNAATRSLFVTRLFQSLEIALKYLGITSGVFTEEEARRIRSGHGIKELAWAIAKSLHATDFTPVSMALTYNTQPPTERYINLMMYGTDFEATRNHYARRELEYGEFEDGQLAFASNLPCWVDALKQVANRLDKAVEIVSAWQGQPQQSTTFRYL